MCACSPWPPRGSVEPVPLEEASHDGPARRAIVNLLVAYLSILWEPLTALIEIEDETVTWSEFRQSHRTKWNVEAAEKRIGHPSTLAIFSYEGLGPFTFDHKECEAELSQPRVAP